MLSSTSELIDRMIPDLASADSGHRRAASQGLVRVGVQDHASLRPRGSLFESAASALSAGQRQALTPYLKDHDPVVRSHVALAMGHLAGPEAAGTIAALATEEADEEVTLYYVEALRMLGGTDAARVLQTLLRSPRPRVVAGALDAVEELATGGKREIVEEVDASFVARSAAEQDLVESLQSTLTDVARDPAADAVVRSRACRLSRKMSHRVRTLARDPIPAARERERERIGDASPASAVRLLVVERQPEFAFTASAEEWQRIPLDTPGVEAAITWSTPPSSSAKVEFVLDLVQVEFLDAETIEYTLAVDAPPPGVAGAEEWVFRGTTSGVARSLRSMGKARFELKLTKASRTDPLTEAERDAFRSWLADLRLLVRLAADNSGAQPGG